MLSLAFAAETDRHGETVVRVARGVAIAAGLLFALSVFKHISYPLLWNDEGMTAMHSERVLRYGFPKVSDGKNNVYDLLNPDLSLGVDEATDAYIGGAGWAQYYLGAPAAWLARRFADPYLKTMILRSWFALLGLAGLAIFAAVGLRLFERERERWAFLALFLLSCLMSIPLTLQLREFRYPPLVVLETAAVVWLYTAFRIERRLGPRSFGAALAALLWLAFVTFSPLYLILTGCIVLHELLLIARHRGLPPGVAPVAGGLAASFVLVLPCLLFLETWRISSAQALYYREQLAGFAYYLANLQTVVRFLRRFDHLYLLALLEVALFALRGTVRSSPRLRRRRQYCVLLALLLAVYTVIVARMPNALFARYFIVLQPLVTLMVLIDLFTLWEAVRGFEPPTARSYRSALVKLSLLALVPTVPEKVALCYGHFQEMTEQYKGPLDFLVPYITESYPDPAALVIATNYEEAPLMYYLGSRVVVGYVKYGRGADLAVIPEILVFRQGWLTPEDERIFHRFRAAADYTPVRFPVDDYQVNNIPEVNLRLPFLRHQFETRYATRRDQQTVLWKLAS
jgi:hypothetical protein